MRCAVCEITCYSLSLDDAVVHPEYREKAAAAVVVRSPAVEGAERQLGAYDSSLCCNCCDIPSLGTCVGSRQIEAAQFGSIACAHMSVF
jgi:hypothetical protein